MLTPITQSWKMTHGRTLQGERWWAQRRMSPASWNQLMRRPRLSLLLRWFEAGTRGGCSRARVGLVSVVSGALCAGVCVGEVEREAERAGLVEAAVMLGVGFGEGILVAKTRVCGGCCAQLVGYMKSVGDVGSVFVLHFVLLCQKAVLWLSSLRTHR